ncbi:SAM-dependent methyltransferase [Bradyrhizobium prioriisuperbiae]|uniref:SAM-dependent methyltransferase n=1 Tax=Bradyrhizobium prioriisuperbiae TaxID=2854389 RepID=UPI0028E8B0F1|nr:SAM-dependent methyltransferase [Bradyrhizobium prioritasuperba]
MTYGNGEHTDRPGDDHPTTAPENTTTNGARGNGHHKGSLVVVGTGIRTVGHLTMEAVAWIKQADKVLYVVGDPVAEAMLKDLNPAGAESLTVMYAEGKERLETYNQMIERTLECVRAGMVTCMACYGHPGVFVYPSHESIRRARAEGYSARMLPGISSEDCLFADLGVDPGISGCQSYEATDFLLNGRVIDPSSSVVLWQIGVVGDATFKASGYDLSAMPLLIERLLAIYPATHPMYLYEAAIFHGCEPTIRPITVAELGQGPLSAGYTLYIPPAYATRSDMTTYYRMNAMIAATKATSGAAIG